ncbi:MAG: sugar phosphate isomerase/epimerase family protein [Planctomycetota bacterium]
MRCTQTSNSSPSLAEGDTERSLRANRISRRGFAARIGVVAGCTVATAACPFPILATTSAIEPFQRLAPGRLRLSLAAYSMRDFLKENKEGWDLFRFVDYCHELNVPGAELTSYYFPKDVTSEYLTKLKQHCHVRGITVSGGAIANDFCQADAAKVRADIESTKRWIDRYAILGANVIRIFAGTQPKDQSWEDTMVRCVTAIEEVADYAHQKGIYLGLENHGGVTATAQGLLDIVQRVNTLGFGVNFDSGNFRSTSDPYAELSAIAPYAVNAQLKVEMFPDGKREETDLARVLRILADANYSGWVALEYEAADPPLEAIPRWIERLQEEIGKRKL